MRSIRTSRLFWLLVILGVPAVVSSQPALTRGPYLQALLADSVKVLWLTDVPAIGVVRYWPVDTPDGTARVVEEDTAGTRHEVAITGLTPWTSYHYEVLAGDTLLTPDDQSPEFHEFEFRTAPVPGTGSFRAAVLGDSQMAGVDQNRVARLLLEDFQSDFDLFLHAGDIGGWDHVDDMLFQQYQRLVRKTSLYVAPGNHNIIPVEIWYEIFSPPELVSGEIPPCEMMPRTVCDEDPPQGAEVPAPRTSVYYSFDWGPAHIAFIDSNRAHGGLTECSDQLKWLCNDLTAARERAMPWLFLFLHHPTYSTGWYGPAPNSQNAFLDAHRLIAPLADRFGIDIVFCGHDHNYQRSYPIKDDIVVDGWQDPHFVKPRGTVYVVTGGGGGMLYGRFADSYHRKHIKVYEKAYHAVELEVSTTRIRLRAHTPDKVLLDDFTISKEEDRPVPGFLRGDMNYSGTIDLSDAIRLLSILFLGVEDQCPGAYDVVADINSTGNVDIADPVFLLRYLFLDGPMPAPPFGTCEPLPDFNDAFCVAVGGRL